MTMFLEIQRLIWVLSIVVHNICCFFLCLMFDNLFALVNSSLLSVKRKRKNYDKNTLPFIKSTTIFINTVFVYACLFRKAIYYKHCIHMYSMIIIYFNTTHNMFYINHLKKIDMLIACEFWFLYEGSWVKLLSQYISVSRYVLVWTCNTLFTFVSNIKNTWLKDIFYMNIIETSCL